MENSRRMVRTPQSIYIGGSEAGILQDDSFSVIDLELKADKDTDKKGYVIITIEQKGH